MKVGKTKPELEKVEPLTLRSYTLV